MEAVYGSSVAHAVSRNMANTYRHSAALATGLRAQDNATITGTVTDASGAVVPNADISLINSGTGQIREAKSNECRPLPVCRTSRSEPIRLPPPQTGFQKSTRTGIVVNVAQTVAADMALTVGSAAQSITVEAQALQVQTETSEVSTLISGEQVRQLATNGRNVVQLAALGLGVSNQIWRPSVASMLLPPQTPSASTASGSAHNVYLIDGAEQNDRGCGGCFMNLPSQDAIGEFQTLGSNYAADYGIGSGGTIVMVIKSGQRQFHGSLYEFNRNTAYNANDYFLKQRRQIAPHLPAQHAGRQHRRPAVDSSRLQRAEESHLLLLE